MPPDTAAEKEASIPPSSEDAAQHYQRKSIMDGLQETSFQRRASADSASQPMSSDIAWKANTMETIFGGVAIVLGEDDEIGVAMGVRNPTYFLDFACFRTTITDNSDAIITGIIKNFTAYEVEHQEKLLGVSVPENLTCLCPDLCSRLWLELDVIPLVFEPGLGVHNTYWDEHKQEASRTIDELADSMSRRCIAYFGPTKEPALQVGYNGAVDVDVGSRASLVSLERYRKCVRYEANWRALMTFATEMKERNLKMAFFSATPQGGGVALMRHSLLRLLKLLGVQASWYVPRPSPGTFRITKTNHNILQGVAPRGMRVRSEDQQKATDWILRNARRYWFDEHGPLRPPEKGGADIVIIDDPQMPSLIPLIKEITPDRPVIYRSHIQIRSDLVDIPDCPQGEVWAHVWKSVKFADMFISQPAESFVPSNVPRSKVAYLPASTDFLDGLNKPMSEETMAYYGREFNSSCRQMSMITLDYPNDEYFIQVARFDPSKGIINTLEAYSFFWDILLKAQPHVTPPKLVICGHGSIDDPDGTMVYNSTMDYINGPLRHLKSSVCVLRVQSSDQILNTLMTKATVALQLSTREGFEIKVSEALHHGKPVITTKAGGIPLQVQHGRNGFMVNIGDTRQVAKYLYDLYTDKELYKRMSDYARISVSDELSTVGNALSWLYLATNMTKKEISPNEQFINDMAREAANEPYGEDPKKIPRNTHIQETENNLPSGGK